MEGIVPGTALAVSWVETWKMRKTEEKAGQGHMEARRRLECCGCRGCLGVGWGRWGVGGSERGVCWDEVSLLGERDRLTPGPATPMPLRPDESRRGAPRLHQRLGLFHVLGPVQPID